MDGTVADGVQAQTKAQIATASHNYLALFPAIVPEGQQAATAEQTDLLSARYMVNFPGTVSNGEQAQSVAKIAATSQAYSIAHAQFQADASLSDAYYKAHIGAVKSVEDLTADQKLFDYVKAAFGINHEMTADEFNAAARDPSLAAKDRLTAVFARFNFQADGTVAVGARAQTAEQIAVTSAAYLADATPDGAVAAGDLTQSAVQIASTSTNYMINYKAQVQTALQNTTVIDKYNMTVPSFVTAAGADAADAYYKSKIGSITSVEELVADPELFEYVKAAVNMDKREPPNTPEAVYRFDFLQSVKNPTYAKAIGMTEIVAQFNFLLDGTLAPGSQVQTGDQISALSKAYFANVKIDQSEFVTNSADNYQARLQKVKNLDDFMKTNATADTDKGNDGLPELYQMALRAFGISPGELSRAEVKKILQSNPYDPKSYVNSLKDQRLTDFVKSFNFDAKGELRTPVQALSQTQINSYISANSRHMQIGLTGAAATKAASDAKAAGIYFATNIVKVKNLDDFLKDSKLTSLVLTANGISPDSVDIKTLKKAFESDPADPRSFTNSTEGRKFKKIVDAFNFETKTKVTTLPIGTTPHKTLELTDAKIGVAQNKGALNQTLDRYLNQTLETQQGETNNGVRLALYFQRKAPEVSSIYDLMADSALYQVIATAFSLPSSMSNMDVEQQAKTLRKLVDITDLQDPAKVSKLLQRFSAMYDRQNVSTPSAALSILQGSAGGVGINPDLMFSIAMLKQR